MHSRNIPLIGRCALVALAALLLSIPNASAQAQDSGVATLLKQAAALESRGRYDLATQTWRRALLADPDQVDALLGLARTSKRAGDLAEAERLVQRLRSLAPNRPEIDEVESMRSLVGQQERLRAAQRLASMEQYEEAMAIYREVIGSSAPPGGLATSYYETEAATAGGRERAINSLRNLTARFPGAAAYKLSLGRLLTYRPQTRAEGVELLSTIDGDSETNRMARSALRQALIWEGPSPRSAAALEAYLATDTDPELERILAAARRAAAGGGVVTSGAAEARGYEALDEERFDDAERAFREALRVTPRSAGATAGLGFVRLKQQRFNDAEDYLSRARELDPTDQVIEEALAEAHYWSTFEAGRLALEGDQLAEATARFREALELRPGHIDAAGALAGALMRQGRAAEAAPLFERVVAAKPNDAESWKALIRTIHDSDGFAAALERSKRIPEALSLELERDVEHLILMASIYGRSGRRAQFDLAFQKVLRNTPNDPDALTPVRLQFAGLLHQMGRSLEAAAEYERTVEADAENVDAWEGLIAALMSESNGRAMAVLGRMPQDVYEEALTRPGFLFNVGLIHREAGRLAEASTFLRSTLGMGDKLSREQQIATRLQLAYINVERTNWAEAERSLRNLSSEFPMEPEVWKGLVSALHEQGRTDEARAESERIPATVITRLYNDPDYVSLMASIHNAQGKYSDGLRMVRDAVSVYEAERKTVPAELEIQMGWLLLNSGRDAHEQYNVMQRVSARDDLTEKQRMAIDELWTVWSLREANSASQTEDYQRATSILAAALKLYPDDTRLYAALAGAFLDAGDHAQSLFVYRNWGLRNGSPEDFSGAIGAAMTMKDKRLVSRWLRQGLETWPENSNLLSLAGSEAASRGDYERAEQYWQLALEAMPGQSAVGGQGEESETSDLGRLLVAGVLDPSSDEPYAPLAGRRNSTPIVAEYAAARGPVTDSLSDALDPVRRRAARSGYSGQRESSPPVRLTPGSDPYRRSDPSGPLPALAFDPKRPFVEAGRPGRDPRENLEEQLATLHARNSPYSAVSPVVRTRSGREGFETLSEQQLNFEAATVVRDKFRVALVARPTYLDAGNPDGNSELRLGLAPSGSTIGPGTASGIGAEAQISSESFGLRVGSTPDGFLVRNMTLGLRVKPGNGPLSLLFDRDVVRDTMLSYAGVRDPISGQVFGGVMANSLSVQGDWAGVESGVFLRAGYQHITGDQVQTNRRIDGGGGAWWRMLETRDGSLTVGANLFAMKYDKNLRFFTLGHGGYFSPQRYVLFNMPVTWKGRYEGRFDYSLTGSLGIQHIMEDDAPYFPRDAALQGRNGPFYEGLAQTGEHFTLELEGGYRVAPHWNLGGFVAINNTRNFTDQRAGIYMRYLFRPQPLQHEMSVPSVPDWRGARQIGLP